MAVAEIKFCGLTRREDAAVAVALAADYAGVIFAGGPRHLEPSRARDVLSATVGSKTRRVGVVASQTVDELLEIARVVPLDVLRLYAAD